MTRRTAVAVAVALVLGAFAIWRLPVGTWVVSLAEDLRQMGAAGVVLFIAAYVVAELALIPGSLLTLAAGFAYGPVKGFLVVSPASVLAATVAFVLSRTVLRTWARKRIARSPMGRAINGAVHQNSFKLIVLLRLSPVIPFNLLNYALGLSEAPVGRYVAASFIGMIPGTWLYVYLGSLVPNATGLTTAARAGGPAGTMLMLSGLAATVAAATLVTRAARQALKAEMAVTTSASGAASMGSSASGASDCRRQPPS